MTTPIPGPQPYTTDLLENLNVAILALEHGGPGPRDPKAVAGLRLAAEQTADLVAACREAANVLNRFSGLGFPSMADAAEACRKAILDAGGTP